MSAPNDSHDQKRDGTVLHRIVSQRRTPPGPVLEPGSAFEAMTRQMVLDLTNEIHALRARIDGLFGVVVGSILLDLLLRLAGWH